MTDQTGLPRREFLKRSGLAAAMLLQPDFLRQVRGAEAGRFSARPHKPTGALVAGEETLDVQEGRRSILFVPSHYVATTPVPFMLALHGATGSGESMLRNSRAAAELHGVVVLAPSSVGGTWDAIRGGFGDDLTRIDRMMNSVFDRCAIDPSRVAIAGFSDGATYAVSSGLMNGDLFTHVIAHSPGFIIPGTRHGRPKVFLSHGRQDDILPIDRCGRRIATELRRDGYSLRFDEFDGGHVATPEMRETAMGWFTG